MSDPITSHAWSPRQSVSTMAMLYASSPVELAALHTRNGCALGRALAVVHAGGGGLGDGLDGLDGLVRRGLGQTTHLRQDEHLVDVEEDHELPLHLADAPHEVGADLGAERRWRLDLRRRDVQH